MRQVLYLHGFTGGGWEAQALQLRWGVPVQGVTMPGHGGQLAGERYDFEEAVRRVLSVAEEAGDKEVSLVGYSMGARVGLAAALRKPDCFHRVVLIGVRPGLEDPKERQDRVALDELRARKLEELGVERFMDWWESLPVIASQADIEPVVREEMRRVRRRHWGPGLAESLRQMGSGVMPSLWAELEHIEVPSLLVTGERDAAFAALAERMTRRSSLLTHASLVGAGHCAHWEQPAAFRALLVGFLGLSR